MPHILDKPYPFLFNTQSAIVPALIIFVLILFYKPLGFAQVDLNERVIMALVISLITAVSIIICTSVLKKWTPKFTNADKWTIGKEILLWLLVLLIINIAISMVFMGVVLYQYPDSNIPTFKFFVRAFSRTISVIFLTSIIPIGILILYQQSKHQKKQLKKANLISEYLKQELEERTQIQSALKDKVLFTSHTNNVELQLDANDIVFIQSDGNYIEVHYSNNGNAFKKLIRNRIKSIEASLPKDTFFRCHNRYIVNKKFITKINGNARGLTLELINSTASIPVSRSKIKYFETFLKS